MTVVSTADVTITGYDNEDIARPFTIVTGDATSPSPFSLSDFDLEMDIVDAKTSAVVLRLTTNELDHRIVILDAASGMIVLNIGHGTIPFNAKQALKYDLLLKSKTDDTFTRAFGGTVKILDGCTTPV